MIRRGGAIALAWSMLAISGDCAPGADVALSTWSARSVGANDPVAVAVQEAFDADGVLASKFLIVPDTVPAEQQADWVENAGKGLARLRAAFPEKMAVKFVDGIEFTIKKPGRPVESFICPMLGESTKDPSMFRLTTRQSPQAYLIYQARMNNGEQSLIHLLMWPAGNGWKAADIGVWPLTMGGLDFDAACQAARREEELGRPLLAMALYGVAGRVAGGTPYRMSGNQHRLQPELASFQARHVQPGRPLAVLAESGLRCDILGLQAVQFDTGLYLALARSVNKLPPERKALESNWRIAVAFLRQHSDMKDYFAGIAIICRSTDPTEQGKTFRSMYTLAELAGPRFPSTQPAATQSDADEPVVERRPAEVGR